MSRPLMATRRVVRAPREPWRWQSQVDPLAALRMAPEEIDRRNAKRERRAWWKRQAHWLAFAAALLAGGLFYGWLLHAYSSPLVNALKVAAVLVLAIAGAVAIVRALLASEEA